MNSYSIDASNICEQLIISDVSVSDVDYYSGNPYNTTFYVKVISGEFVGISQFEYNIKDFIRFVKEINELYHFKLKIVELNDIGYGSNIQFCLDKTGHITISGMLYGHAMEHSLTFRFIIDQTAIKIFSDSLYKDFIVENTYKV